MQAVAVALGGPGLFIIGYLDSSFLSFPMINDLLIIGMVTPPQGLRCVYYVLMATLGSVLGCLPMYYVARKGGEAFLAKRFKAHHVEGGMKLFQKYGLLVVIVPALLPPPAPFKIFVLLAGVAAIPVWQFADRDLHRALHPLRRRGAAGGLVRRQAGGLPAGQRQGGRALAGRARRWSWAAALDCLAEAKACIIKSFTVRWVLKYP